jgi:glucokinase
MKSMHAGQAKPMRFGMDYGGTNLKCGVFKENGDELVFTEKPLKELTTSGRLIDNLVALGHEVTEGFIIDGGGLAIKGMVDTVHGVVREDIGAGSLLAGIELRKEFSERLGFPFAVENDARAYALGEWKFGAGRGSKVLVCMTLGTGLGCSVVLGGTSYSGADPLGGLLGGHISIDRHGPLCPCGNRGCLELYCSATALHRRVSEVHLHLGKHEGDALRSFFSGVRKGLPEFMPTFHTIIDDLALGVVNVIHAYSPDVVVLGGGVMQSADVILPELRSRVHQMAWTVPRGSVDIRAAHLGNRAAALGVAFHPMLET